MLFSLSFFTLVTLATSALGSPPPGPRRAFGPDLSISLEPSSGVGTTTSICDQSEGGDCAAPLFTLGAAALARWSFLELGMQLDASGNFLGGGTHVFASGLAGLQLDMRDWARLELLGEVGTHSMEDVGTYFMTATREDVDVTLPFAGLRIGASARLGRGSARFILGAWVAMRADLEHRDRTVAQTTCFLGCSTSDRTYDLGGTTTQVGLRLGVEVR